MIDCLIRVTGDSIQDYLAIPRCEWVKKWPGQVVICVDNIYWTKETTEAIDNNSLPDYYKVCVDQLLDVVELVRGDLTKLIRKTLTAMVTIDVHNRDVIKMCESV